MTAVPDMFDELCLVGVMEQGGTEQQFASITEDITAMDWGEKDIESKAMLSGGRAVHKKPMTDESITLRMYPISVGLASGTTGVGVMQHFHPQSVDDNTVPLAVINTNNRNKFRIVLLWATTLPATASTIPEAGVYAQRIQIFNAYLTKAKPSYDDKGYIIEATFKWAPFQKDGTRNKIEESTDDSAQLPAVTGFT